MGYQPKALKVMGFSASYYIRDKIQEVPMPPEIPQELKALFRWQPWHIGDPAVLLESILGQVEVSQRQQITALYLDSITASLEANLKFVQGLRSILTSANK